MIVSLEYSYGEGQLRQERRETKRIIRALQAKVRWISRELKLRYPPKEEQPNDNAQKRAPVSVSASV